MIRNKRCQARALARDLLAKPQDLDPVFGRRGGQLELGPSILRICDLVLEPGCAGIEELLCLVGGREIESFHASDELCGEGVGRGRSRPRALRRHLHVHEVGIRNGLDIDCRPLAKAHTLRHRVTYFGAPGEVCIGVLEAIEITQVVRSHRSADQGAARLEAKRRGCRVLARCQQAHDEGGESGDSHDARNEHLSSAEHSEVVTEFHVVSRAYTPWIPKARAETSSGAYPASYFSSMPRSAPPM